MGYGFFIRSFGYLRRMYRQVCPIFYTSYLTKQLNGCDSVLDLGCGNNSPIQFVKADYKVGVELFKPYMQESKRRRIHDRYIIEDIRKLKMKTGSFDAVVALDVLEHLNKSDGLSLIKKMELWARKKVVVFTPNGLVFTPDSSGGFKECEKNPLQIHKSGWEVEELRKLGFKVRGINGLKFLRKGRGNVKYEPSRFGKFVSAMTQMFAFYFPSLSFQLFAVKTMKHNRYCVSKA